MAEPFQFIPGIVFAIHVILILRHSDASTVVPLHLTLRLHQILQVSLQTPHSLNPDALAAFQNYKQEGLFSLHQWFSKWSISTPRGQLDNPRGR